MVLLPESKESLQAEVERLRDEQARITEQRNILKKAAGIRWFGRSHVRRWRQSGLSHAFVRQISNRDPDAGHVIIWDQADFH